MKNIITVFVTISLLLLSGCEKGFDYRNKWEGNYEVYESTVSGDDVVQIDEKPMGYLTLKKNADDEMRFEFGFSRDGNYIEQWYNFRVDKKGNISMHGADGHFIKRSSFVLTIERHGSRNTYYCKKTKKDYHDVVHGL